MCPAEGLDAADGVFHEGETLAFNLSLGHEIAHFGEPGVALGQLLGEQHVVVAVEHVEPEAAHCAGDAPVFFGDGRAGVDDDVGLPGFQARAVAVQSEDDLAFDGPIEAEAECRARMLMLTQTVL